MTLSRNGMRHAQAANACSPKISESRRKTVLPSKSPTGTPHLGEAATVTPLALGGVLRRQEHRSAPLSADGEALQEAQHEEGYRGGYPDGLVGRQEAYERRRRAHGQQRDYQGRFAAEPVSEVAEE